MVLLLSSLGGLREKETIRPTAKMKSFLSLFVLLFAAVVHAASASGDRLLVVLDDVAEKDAYSTFLGDLEGACQLPSISEQGGNSIWCLS